jgi:hypothetical protein
VRSFLILVSPWVVVAVLLWMYATTPAGVER